MLRNSFKLAFLMALLGCSETPRFDETEDEIKKEVRTVASDTLVNELEELARQANTFQDSKKKAQLLDVLENIAKRDSTLDLYNSYDSLNKRSRFK